MQCFTPAPSLCSIRRLFIRAVVLSALAVSASLPGHAAIIHVVNNVVVDGLGVDGPISQNLDWDGDGTQDATISFSPTLGGIAASGTGFQVVTSGTEVARFGNDVEIGAGLDYGSSANFYTGSIPPPPAPPFPILSGTWITQDAGYFGFRFDYDGTTAFGWANFVPHQPSTYAATVTEWAFDTTGASILTGATASAVPEPSVFGLIAGAAGFGFLIIRRKSK